MKMNKTIDVRIKDKWSNTFTINNPMLKEMFETFPSTIEEGDLLDIYDAKKRYIGKAYYGKQNKGLGWMISKNKEECITSAFFEEKIKKAVEKRQTLYNDPETTAFRVFNGEGDDFGGVTIDYFDGFYMMTWYNKGVYSFKEGIIEALEACCTCKGIYEKKRFAKDGKYVEADDFVKGEEAPEPLVIMENSVKYAVYLNDGPMVGIFLDQREVRKSIRENYAQGKQVLNTFSYTGAFSVSAALGGAQTTSVDLANRSRDKTKEQFTLNGIDSETQTIIVEDVFNYFKYANRKQHIFDVVILDPPSFARSKKRTFNVSKDYVELLVDAIGITVKNGVIVASTNYSNFDMNKFQKFIRAAFKETGGTYEILESYSLPEDFAVSEYYPEGNYLKVVFIKKK